MFEKYRLKPLHCYEEPTPDVITTLNYIYTLFHGYEASGVPLHDFAPEFLEEVGQLLDGRDIYTLELGYLEIE
ncbi:MAG: hypothetical protein JSV83_13415 [Desulfobacterales bacterium]|nr:MAG: hypothetical protein JSV83_13415 [Desulfobacterales bacterium]